MVVGVDFCKIKVDSNFLLVLKIKCTKFHQDRSKTIDLHTKYTNKKTFSFIYTRIDFLVFWHLNPVSRVVFSELVDTPAFKIMQKNMCTLSLMRASFSERPPLGSTNISGTSIRHAHLKQIRSVLKTHYIFSEKMLTFYVNLHLHHV
jgi:hypothetical protein